MLRQALQRAVNPSSETLSNETLQIAEMLKKRRGGVERGCNTSSSLSNTRKDIFIHLFPPLSQPLPLILPITHLCLLSFYILSLLSICFFTCLCPFALSLYLSLCHVISSPPLSLPSLPPALPRPWGTIRLTLV